jgi:hypothetical protein
MDKKRPIQDSMGSDQSQTFQAKDDTLKNRLERGWSLYGAGQVGLARLEFEHACLTYSKAFEPWFGLAMCLKSGGEKTAAIKAFEAARNLLEIGNGSARRMMLERIVSAHLRHLQEGKWGVKLLDANQSR